MRTIRNTGQRGLFAALSVALWMASVAGLAAAPANDNERSGGEVEAASSDRRCLGINQIRQVEIIDDSTIHFHMRGGQHDYINHLPHRCAGLKSRGTFMHSTSTSNYCDLDTITVIDTSLGMRLASCPLGRFEAVERGTSSESPE